MSEASHRADRAQQILDDPLFQEAQQIVLQALQTEILGLPLEMRERRETAVAMYKGAQQFFRVFDLIINEHRLEQAELTNEDQVRARLAVMNERLRNV